MAKAVRSRKGDWGICELTKKPGKFVQAHLIPKALTRPEFAGTSFVETSARGQRPKRAWSSWYDNGSSRPRERPSSLNSITGRYRS